MAKYSHTWRNIASGAAPPRLIPPLLLRAAESPDGPTPHLPNNSPAVVISGCPTHMRPARRLPARRPGCDRAPPYFGAVMGAGGREAIGFPARIRHLRARRPGRCAPGIRMRRPRPRRTVRHGVDARAGGPGRIGRTPADFFSIAPIVGISHGPYG